MKCRICYTPLRMGMVPVEVGHVAIHVCSEGCLDEAQKRKAALGEQFEELVRNANCLYCKTPFVPWKPEQIWCSMVCKDLLRTEGVPRSLWDHLTADF